MFKALLVLFVTTAAHPLTPLVVEMPGRFPSESKCREFIQNSSGIVTDRIRIETHANPEGEMADVHGHEFMCKRDSAGDVPA